MTDTSKSRTAAPRALSAAEAIAAPAAVDRFLRQARAIVAADVVPMRADPALVQRNVEAGVAAIAAFADHVREHLPCVDLDELRELPDLALSLSYASSQVDDGAEARPLLAEARALRRRLKASAIALAEAGVLAGKDVKKVGGDRGAVDAGADCATLAALFERRAEDVEGKTAITAEEVARAGEVGAALRALGKPKGAARKAGAHGMSPVEVRDRLWTLLVTRHERLWAVGAYVYGHAVDEHVPALSG